LLLTLGSWSGIIDPSVEELLEIKMSDNYTFEAFEYKGKEYTVHTMYGLVHVYEGIIVKLEDRPLEMIAMGKVGDDGSIMSAIDLLNEKEPHWVDVNDRLPTDSRYVLVKCGGEITYAWCDVTVWRPAGSIEATYDMADVILDGTVTAWLDGLVLPE